MSDTQTSTPLCKTWARPEEVYALPSDTYMTVFVVSLSLCMFILALAARSLHPKDMRRFLCDAGVALHKVTKTAKEIERKTFHIAGLLVPLIYTVLLQYKWSQRACSGICWTFTITGVTADFLRVHSPWVKRNWPLKSILRDKEESQLCGGSYFSLGCTLAIHCFAPAIAMTSIIFLILGDMSAALIGRSFGQSIVTMKVGPGGKKSVEGSAAMYVVCLVVGCVIFGQVHLREYAVVLGALVATIVELYEPFGINDNVTIPVLSSVALTFGFARTFSCEPTHNPLLWYGLYN